MSTLKKLSTFRQLSLNCDTSTKERRKSLKKQFSEDIPDSGESWFDSNEEIKISLSAKTRRIFDRPPQIKIAWDENESKTEDVVVVKKIPEVRKCSPGKLTRHNSLERDLILFSKTDLNSNNGELKEKETEKKNLKIFLTHNIKPEVETKYESNNLEKTSVTPKLIQPLITAENSKHLFQIRKNTKSKINLNDEKLYSPSRTQTKIKNDTQTTTAVENLPVNDKKDNIINNKINEEAKINPKPIDNVIIRPVTAARKQEMFQKRTNLAFNATVRDVTLLERPPLMRSASAPIKSEHHRSKLLTSKRKIKGAKRFSNKHNQLKEDETKENPKNQKPLSRRVSLSGADIVTMVSLISPAGSDNEENAEPEKPSKNKNQSLGKTNSKLSEEKDLQKPISLRKVVKSVSFQQSSIHAIRSFSASFPSRRASLATTLMLTNNFKNVGVKGNEKRNTNLTSSDGSERVLKRRLVSSRTEETTTMESYEDCGSTEQTNAIADINPVLHNDASIVVDIQTKIRTLENEYSPTPTTVANKKDDEEVSNEEKNDSSESDKPKFESAKERQCWDMYCKMTEKGINVSYDTILRGILTPTEYRISKKNLVVLTNEENSTS